MKNYLIFRTDRIGDFLLTCILISNIKRNDRSSIITLVCSEYNYEYVKTFKNIDELIIYKKNFFKYILNIFKLRKKEFSYTIIHDEKDRSKILNSFLRKEKSISFKSSISDTKITIVKKIIQKLGFIFSDEDLNFLSNRDLHTNIKSNYLVLHYDEKWTYTNYIQHYQNIEPNIIELTNFIKKLSKITNYKIIVSTGIYVPNILKKIFLKNKIPNVEFYSNQSFFELEKLVSCAKILISCHGALSHVAAAKNIKQIDIIDTNIKNPYSNWTSHFRNYNYVFRKDFQQLADDIYKLL